MNGLVMLLPHGYEGQGPEHSSARLERYLQMCAELNMVITNITTAANFFHALRRQMAWPFRKPLINFSPKANLRHPGTYSSVDAFTSGSFAEVIDDAAAPKNVEKVLFCSGKIYFDLIDYRQQQGITDTAVVRVEQIYPLPVEQLQKLHTQYGNAQWRWVQEEPLNMGAASFMKMNLEAFPFTIIARKASAATATGFSKVHAAEQQEIIKNSFA